MDTPKRSPLRSRKTRLEQLEPRHVMTTTFGTLAINAGGPAIGDFLEDQFFEGANQRTFGPNGAQIADVIDTTGVENPAPEEVYRTERSTAADLGSFSYNIPNLIPGETYQLRLHFAEIFFEGPGARIFDVAINNTTVLDDYDVVVESQDPGPQAEAVVIEEFTVTAQANGVLEIDFSASVNNPKLSALELTGEFPDPPDPPEPDPNAPRVLFVRGADRSGGFLEAGSDFSRTEQLSSIFNEETFDGNHGWAELRETLEAAGFIAEEITETVEAGNTTGQSDGVPIDFELLDLDQYDAIVFGSNNAVYDTAAIDAIEDYVRSGGSTLFISDANFGSDFADASNSDQQFLDRFGIIAHQDQGTYSVFRSQGDFNVPDHPILTNVNRFDGEGVTPFRLGTPTAGVTQEIIVGVPDNQITRLNEPPFGNNNAGPSRSGNPQTDGVLLVAQADQGRVVSHFDRNTFFNQNGAGSNINNFDNQQYALNLFGFLVGAFDELPGDYDGSGVVDAGDQAVFAASFGATGDNSADGNGDGIVNAADFVIARDLAGTALPPVNLTPPSSTLAPAVEEGELSDAALLSSFAVAPVVSSEVPAVVATTATPTNKTVDSNRLLVLDASTADAVFDDAVFDDAVFDLFDTTDEELLANESEQAEQAEQVDLLEDVLLAVLV